MPSVNRSVILDGGTLTRRFWLGVAIAPFIAAVVYEALIFIDPTAGKTYTNEELLTGFVFGLLPASYILCLSFGAPLVLLLKRKDILSCSMLVWSAGALSAVSIALLLFAAFVISDAHWEQFDWKRFFLFLGGAGMYGAFVAGVFCMVAGITWSSIGCAEAARR